jgi:aspartyl-tRNA(Asn)/glutamyl-tRNA(Gln) amidotransferase subunit A
MTNLSDLTISDARDKLTKREISSVELTEHFLKRIAEYKELNAFITVTGEAALDSADDADRAIRRGETLPLLGIPLAIKDLFCTRDVRTTAGSLMLDDFIPPYESTVTARLKMAGAVFLGKTNMDEFAMGSANVTSYYGPAKLCYRKRSNPDAELTPGGSSGGSAAAVAAGLALGAIGSDTGGSVRQPAAFCGLVGMKPTYGLCSRYGMIAFASSLDQAGPLSKTVRDSAIILNSIAGYDSNDSTSCNVKIPNYTLFLGESIKGMRIGIVKQCMTGIDEEGCAVIKRVEDILKSAGCEFFDIDLKMMPYVLPAYYVIAPAEASSNLARYDGIRYGMRIEGETVEDIYVNTRSQGFGEEVKRRILTGTYVLSASSYDSYYGRALKIRKMVKDDFRDNAFSKVDLILTLTTPGTAFEISEAMQQDAVQLYLCDVFTVAANIAGLPAISVPAGLSADGLPIGVQLIGPNFSEGKIFAASEVIEKSVNFHELRKSIVSVC